jgi:hypothetical protein
MTGQWWNRKILTLMVAALTCAVVAVFALAYPTEIASPTLGAEWQCHRTVGILTSCSRVSHVVPMNIRTRTRATDIRRV